MVAKKGTITIELEEPIRPVPPLHLALLVVGLMMALHPLAWLILLHYEDTRNDFQNEWVVSFLDAISHGILTLVPKVASSLLTFFLSGFFLYLGIVNLSPKR